MMRSNDRNPVWLLALEGQESKSQFEHEGQASCIELELQSFPPLRIHGSAFPTADHGQKADGPDLSSGP